MDKKDLKMLLDLIGDFWDSKEVENNKELENSCWLIYDSIFNILNKSESAWSISENIKNNDFSINKNGLQKEIAEYKDSLYKDTSKLEKIKFDINNIYNIINRINDICKKYTDFDNFYRIDKSDLENLKVAIFLGHKTVVKFGVYNVCSYAQIGDVDITYCDLISDFNKIFENF